jgi:lipopolysaccharide transport system ATP-binding protein
MSTVITVENLGKKYLLNHQSGQQPYVALRDVLSDGARKLGRKLLGRGNTMPRGPEKEEFWALKDVSFEVKQGERIGIIGRNGAGKSTLLKILSRITEPTTGSVRIKGRVASLLEVGTGFHPELTGRENIFLNGAILGMGRAEIKNKFDEIVDFAEIEKFLDTPVKRYSSGMYVRLAFAVAAHLEPEILVVDEVLAVGDAQFQKKCLGKMEEVSAKEGRTVLFVSHNLQSIKYLCCTGMLLHMGEKLYMGNIDDVVRGYERAATESVLYNKSSSNSLYHNKDIATHGFDVLEISLWNDEGASVTEVKTFDSFIFDIKFYSPDQDKSKSPILIISNLVGTVLLRLGMRPYSAYNMEFKKGVNDVTCRVERLPLPAGTYLLSFGIIDQNTGSWFFDKDLCLFEVMMSDIYRCGLSPLDKHAVAVVDYAWDVMP